MGTLVTYEQYMNMLSERVLDNSRQLKRVTRQRRNGMEDLYGVCFSSNGDANTPASFYISLSPDYGYLQRFAFKFVIKPFKSSVSGVSGGGSLTIDETSLSGGNSGEHIIADTSTLEEESNGITPNPHTHSASGSIGGLDYGVTTIGTTSSNWRVVIDGIDITALLIAQHDGEWIHGQGVYPNTALEADIENFYDILEVCDVLTDLGMEEERDKILRSRFKEVQIRSDAPFSVDAYLYLKYDHTNR